MSTDPLPRAMIDLQSTMEAVYHVTFLELIAALAEQGSLDPERLRQRLEAASDDISKQSVISDLPVRAAEPGVRLLQQLADGVARQHKLASRTLA